MLAAKGKQILAADQKRFYSTRNMLWLSATLASGAVLANTKVDGEFQRWYQSEMRSTRSDDFAAIVKPFGDGKTMVPIYLGAFAMRYLLPESKIVQPISTWAATSLRTILVGAPPLLFLQVGVGGSRPTENDSHWRPFNDNNGVSGHAFMGATPFLAGATVVKSPWLKSGFYAASTLTAWSRINDDKHYLSQAMMGWFIALIASKNILNDGESRIAFTPQIQPGRTCIAFIVMF